MSGEDTHRLAYGPIWDWYALLFPMLAVSPLLYLQCIYLWEKEHLQFFPLAFIAAGWFLHQAWPPGGETSGQRRRVSLVAAFAAYLLCATSLVFNSAWLAHLTLIGLIWTWAAGRLGGLTLLRITAICGLMVVTVPVPFGGDQKLVQSLQSLSTTVSGHLMDAAGILHVKRGNILEISSQPLFVEEACSGVDSQYALMTVAGVMLLVGRTGVLVSLITIVTVPIWAILGNLLRIFSIVIGLEWLDVDLSSGLAHTVLGLFAFAVAAWLHWSSVQFLNFMQWSLFPGSVSADAESSAKSRCDVSAVSARGGDRSMRVPRWMVAGAVFLLLWMPSAAFAVVAHHTKNVPRIDQAIADRFPGENAISMTVGNQSCVAFQNETREIRSIIGQHSRTWSYVGNLGHQLASLDLPFRGWHSLWVCYGNAGWKRTSLVEVSESADGQPLEFPFFEMTFENPEGEFATVHFSLFDENGNPFRDQPKAEDGARLGRLGSTVLSRWLKAPAPRDPLTFQFQLFSQTPDPATPQQIAEFRRMYLQLRQQVYEQSMPVVRELQNL